MPTAHCVGTPDGTILHVDHNFCLLMGRAEADLIGMSYKALTFASDIDKSAKMLSGLADRDAPTRMSKRYVRPDRSVVRAEILVSKFDKEGRIVTTLWWNDDDRFLASPRALWSVAVHVRHLYSCRMQELGADLFGDFIGAILLHAYLAEAEGRIVRIEDIAKGVGISIRTTERWATALDKRGLLCVSDEGARTVQLTAEGVLKMEALLTAAIRPASYPPKSLSSA
ncbi:MULTISPECIES: PAS domain-containing protein [unclassified Sphingomonas]|uniref:PAS domain-containing protein n=1 Tax=unclassified Sphingomonas TaxID=196159 RepID=UPI002269F279|nr:MULTISPECIES: PAS domain-containing protein [unclassified Sphingomonas]